MNGLQDLPVSRDPGGSWASGNYVRGTPETALSVLGSVQPIGFREVERLPEGARTKARFLVYAGHEQPELRGTDMTIPAGSDRVTYEGRDYDVLGVQDLTGHAEGLPHRVYALLEEGADG